MAASDQFCFNIAYPDHKINGNNCTKSIRCYQVEPHGKHLLHIKFGLSPAHEETSRPWFLHVAKALQETTITT